MSDWCQVNEKYYRYKTSEPTKEDLLLQSLCIPTQTEIRSQLGSKLADVFFENLSTERRVFLGLEPPLTVPKEVWVDPDLRLKKRVRCKPIPEPHSLYQKAFTHQTILELGERCVESLRLKMMEEINEALRVQANELEEVCNRRLFAALQDAKVEADENCKQVVGTLMEHFERCFDEVVEKNKLRMRKECQFQVREERAEIAAYMLSQLQEEVKQRDLELCTDFYATLNGELNALAAKYVEQIDSERKVAQEVMQELVRKYETMLANLKSEMEVCSFVDICRAITEEKAKHERESREAEEEIRNRTKSFAKVVAALRHKNKTLHEMATERGKRLKQYEKKMARLIQEFQKFVNFALKSVPAHAEYLLSAEKMMMKKYHEDCLSDPEDYEDYKNCLMGKPPKGEKARRRESPRREESREIATGKGEERRRTREDSRAVCEKEDEKYSFNYHIFKYHLLKNLVKGIKFGTKQSGPLEAGPCGRKESVRRETFGSGGEEASEDAEEEWNEQVQQYKQALTLVGETEKEHLQPVNTFLTQRMRAVAELCRNDPAMVKMMLGRPQT